VNEGRRPTILFYHKALGAMLEPEAAKLRVADRVHTYHAWTTWMWKQVTGVRRAPAIADFEYDWAQMAKEANRIVASRERLDMVDVIVDEGQDLPKAFFALLRAIGANVTVFADENQKLTPVHSSLAEIRDALLGANELEVRRNFRNTKPVAELARRFYTGTRTGTPTLPDRPGAIPRLVRCSDLDGLARLVAGTTLVDAKREEVGVFVLRTGQRDDLAEKIKTVIPLLAKELAARQPSRADALTRRAKVLAESIHTYAQGAPAPPLGRPGIFVICHASGKGLEFDVTHIWLAGSKDHEETEEKMRMYVLASRPRHELYLEWPGASDARADAKLPPWVSDIPKTTLERVTVP
jgi:hypothetical protein